MKLVFTAISIAVFMFAANAFATAPTALTAKVLSETPVQLAAVAVDSVNGNSVSNLAENVILYIKNASGVSTATATVTAQTATQNIPGFGPVTKASVTATLTTGQEWIVGPFPAAAFNDANGLLQITYGSSGAPNLTISAIASSKLMKIP